MPWTYHADLRKYFTGFFSEKDVYGKLDVIKQNYIGKKTEVIYEEDFNG